MIDPLGGTPIRDLPGTVRGDKVAGSWVKVGHSSDGDCDMWVDTVRGEQVSDHTMWLLKLPVVGAVPGTPADGQRQQVELAASQTLEHLVVEAAECLDVDYPESDTADEVVHMVLNALHDLRDSARESGSSVVETIDRLAPKQCIPAGTEGSRECTYPVGHLGPHSFEPTLEGLVRCQAYGDRPCRFPAGHEGVHSYWGRCRERAADGRLCDLNKDHQASAPHDWMATFGNPSIRCHSRWSDQRGGFSQVWRCMFEDGHNGDCSFELKRQRWPRCEQVNKRGAQCWGRVGHGGRHTYVEATR